MQKNNILGRVSWYYAIFSLCVAFQLLLDSIPSFGQSSSTSTSSAKDSKEGNAAAVATYQLTGQATLTSNYIVHGLTQTQKDPSLQGSYWFHFGSQLKVGIWGSNVSYLAGTEHFNLKYQGEGKVILSNNFDVTGKYSINRYYKSGERNGETISLLFHLFTDRVLIEKETNWEGSKSSSLHYSFGRSRPFQLFGLTLSWDNDVGYNDVDVAAYSPYFDLRTAASYEKEIYSANLGITYCLNGGQFNGQGDLFIFGGASIRF